MIVTVLPVTMKLIKNLIVKLAQQNVWNVLIILLALNVLTIIIYMKTNVSRLVQMDISVTQLPKPVTHVMVPVLLVLVKPTITVSLVLLDYSWMDLPVLNNV